MGDMGRRGDRGRMEVGEGPRSGEGERWRLGGDSSRRGDRLWSDEPLPPPSVAGEKARGDASQRRRENSALLLPGEAARAEGQGLRGDG